MSCNKCGGPFTVKPSTFPGWDLLLCADCGRPVRLLSQSGHRVGPVRENRGQLNRMLRAQRRRARA